NGTAGHQLVDLDPNDDGTFNGIVYDKPRAAWAWSFGSASLSSLVDQAGQHGMRLIDVTTYHNAGARYYAGITVDNVTGLTAQLRNMYEGTMPAGATYGFRLRKWNGPVLAALQDDKVIEPASAIKVLIHLHVEIAEQNGLSYKTPIQYHYTTAKWPDMQDAGG